MASIPSPKKPNPPNNNIFTTNPQLPPNCDRAELQTSIHDVSAESHQQIVRISSDSEQKTRSLLVRVDSVESLDLFDVEAGNQVRFRNSYSFLVEERQEMGESVVEIVEVVESFEILEKVESFDGFSVVGMQERAGNVGGFVDFGESFQVIEVGAGNLGNFDGFRVEEKRETVVDLVQEVSGNNGVEGFHAERDKLSKNREFEAQNLGNFDCCMVEEKREMGENCSEMSEAVVKLVQQVSGNNGVESFHAESDNLSKIEEFEVDKPGLIVMSGSSAEMMEGSALSEASSMDFSEMNHANVRKYGTDAGNCRAEAKKDHEMVQCDDKELSGVNVGVQTGNKGVKHQGLMGEGRKRAAAVNQSRSAKEEMKRKNGVGYNRNVKGKVCWIKVNRDLTQNKENVAKRSYSRNEMASLRFSNIEGQQTMWNEVYLRMGPTVAREYEDMVDNKPRKQVCSNFGHRQRVVNMKENGPILSTPKMKGNDSFHSMPTRNENVPILSVMAIY